MKTYIKEILDELIYLRKIILEEGRIYPLELFTAEVKTSEYLTRFINKSFLPAIDRYFILLGQKIQAHFSTGALGALFKNMGQGFANLFSNLGSLFNLSITYNFRVFFVNLANYFVHMYSVIIGSAFFGEFFVRLFAKTADFFLNLANYFKHLFNRFA